KAKSNYHSLCLRYIEGVMVRRFKLDYKQARASGILGVTMNDYVKDKTGIEERKQQKLERFADMIDDHSFMLHLNRVWSDVSNCMSAIEDALRKSDIPSFAALQHLPRLQRECFHWRFFGSFFALNVNVRRALRENGVCQYYWHNDEMKGAVDMKQTRAIM